MELDPDGKGAEAWTPGCQPDPTSLLAEQVDMKHRNKGNKGLAADMGHLGEIQPAKRMNKAGNRLG